MERNNPSGRSYWDHLGAATRALEEGDLPRAEREFDLGLSAREQSPGRVFLTEKITDGLARLFRGSGAGTDGGRWSRRSEQFRQAFLTQAESTVRNAVRLAELRPEDDAAANQPVLAQALFLVGRSRLFSEEPASAVPLLKGLFRTAGKTGQLFDVQLIRHDIPLTEEDRLWLARKGPGLLEEFVAQGSLEPGSPASENWVQIILQLLDARYFGSTSRLEEERAWLQAITTDRLLRKPAEAVERYRQYLQVNPEPGPRPDEARVRLLELLANAKDLSFPVPRYTEALQAMQSAGLALGSQASVRYAFTLSQLDFRRPDPEPGGPSLAWASVGLELDGRVAVVFWWKDQPRDVAFWQVGEAPADLEAFLEPCDDRILARDQGVREVIQDAWPEGPAPWSIKDFAQAFLEPSVPAGGLTDDTMVRLGLGESGPWRDGWKPDLGHPLLEPPRRSALMESWQGGPASGALQSGLVWLAVLARIHRADPSLRAGIGALARRGDPAAGCLYPYLNLDTGLGQTLDASFEPWTLPLLWTRHDPLGGGTDSRGLDPQHPGEAEGGGRPDLGHNDLAIVTTGEPGAVLEGWGGTGQKWRVVLDRLDRVSQLTRIAAQAVGPVTLIPPSGEVHSLGASLEFLESMLRPAHRPTGDVAGLLPLFHWQRCVETHNGDLLDFLQVRQRRLKDFPLYREYQDLVSDIARVAPVLEDDQQVQDPWAYQFSQRVRKGGVVAGLSSSLVADPGLLDALWGVFEGSEVSWVFLDSAAIHWQLLGRPGSAIQDLHTLLHARGHRHLSLLTGAVWMRSELEELLGTWLGVYGRPFCLAMTNLRPPHLRLADQGVAPHATYLRAEALASQVAHVRDGVQLAGSGTVLLPSQGVLAEFWRRIASREIPLGVPGTHYLALDRAALGEGSPEFAIESKAPGSSGLLMVPVLESLSSTDWPLAQEDTREAWALADQDRQAYLRWRRRLCGLEFASLLAGPWETVEILDCRWWRILEPSAEPGVSSIASWNGEKALALAEAESCRVFSLPGSSTKSGNRPDRAIPTQTLDAVRHWLATQGLDPGPETRRPATESAAGQAMITDLPLSELGDLLLPDLARAWERGRFDHWLLVVGDHVPEQAAAVVAAGYHPGLAIWDPAAPPGPIMRPGPLLWCRASDLADPRLNQMLATYPCRTALALEVDDWLPTGNHANQEGALALRTLAEGVKGRLILQVGQAPAAWTQFLADRLDAQWHGAPSPAGPEKTPSPGLETEDQVTPPEGPSFPDAGYAASPEHQVLRLRTLLDRVRPVLASAPGTDGALHDDAGRVLIPGGQLAWLAGLLPEQIAGGVRLMRWIARLAGDVLSDAESAGNSRRSDSPWHTLLIPRRFAELEHQLRNLEDQVCLLLPLVLGRAEPGPPIWFDLDDPPLEMDEALKEQLDIILAFSTLSRTQDCGLAYLCPRGALNSRRRLVQATLPTAEVLDRMRSFLALFRKRLADVLGSATETGAGFLVETGLDSLRPEEEEFLALGSALRMWSWSGPPTGHSLHLVDLLSVAESQTVKSNESAWKLLASTLREGESTGYQEKDPDGQVGSGTRPRGKVTGLKSLLQRGPKADVLDTVRNRVASLAAPEARSGLLVISGATGTGRHEVLAQGLGQVWADHGQLGEVTVYGPDAGAVNHFLTHWARAGCPGPAPDVQVIEPGTTVPRPSREGADPRVGAGNILIMLEIQRFEPETRYQIAQLGRGRRLFMTIDPVAATEPWEHLFLTVPRQENVIHLEVQREVGRRLWTEITKLLGSDHAGKGQSTATERGQVTSIYAVNLDQCLARIVQDLEEGKLEPRLRLAGPLATDLDFLGSCLREKGWLAVAEEDLDSWLLPGARELLASLLETLADLGLLKIFLQAPEEMAGTVESLSASRGEPESHPLIRGILPRYLGNEGRGMLDSWRLHRDGLSSHTTVGEFFDRWVKEPWVGSVLAEPGSAARARQLGKDLSRITLGELPGIGLWEAWWQSAARQLELPDDLPRRPLVLLNPADRPAGQPESTGVYLCLGTERPRQHYLVLSRLTSNVLILYKEKSPLALEESG
jgi:hypothetical protein|nr:hypothetical protein [Candidatus Krumholzibacteria bacterium]